jgi:hypothetical protein
MKARLANAGNESIEILSKCQLGYLAAAHPLDKIPPVHKMRWNVAVNVITMALEDILRAPEDTQMG